MKAETIAIRWPNGWVETLKDLPGNQYYVVREGSEIDRKRTRGVSDLRIKKSAAPAR